MHRGKVHRGKAHRSKMHRGKSAPRQKCTAAKCAVRTVAFFRNIQIERAFCSLNLFFCMKFAVVCTPKQPHKNLTWAFIRSRWLGHVEMLYNGLEMHDFVRTTVIFLQKT